MNQRLSLSNVICKCEITYTFKCALQSDNFNQIVIQYKYIVGHLVGWTYWTCLTSHFTFHLLLLLCPSLDYVAHTFLTTFIVFFSKMSFAPLSWQLSHGLYLNGHLRFKGTRYVDVPFKCLILWWHMPSKLPLQINVPFREINLGVGVGVGQWSSLKGTEYLLHISVCAQVWVDIKILLWRVIELFINAVVTAIHCFCSFILILSSCSRSEEGAPTSSQRQINSMFAASVWVDNYNIELSWEARPLISFVPATATLNGVGWGEECVYVLPSEATIYKRRKTQFPTFIWWPLYSGKHFLIRTANLWKREMSTATVVEEE